MNTSTRSSIEALIAPDAIDFQGPGRQFLERLFNADHAKVSQEDLEHDLSKLLEVSHQINQNKTISEKLDLYISQYRILFKDLHLKYGDFLSLESLKDLTAYEKQMDGIHDFLVACALIVLSLEPEKTQLEKHQVLYTGMVGISSWMDEYLIYFSNDFIAQIEVIANLILSDSDFQLQPEADRAADDNSSEIHSYLLALNNTAHAILHKISNPHERQVRLYRELSADSVFFQDMQIRNNRKLRAWLAQKLNKNIE
jgi:hypothetical protein